MSMFQDGDYEWRDTYFVLFESASRPTLAQVRKKLAGLNFQFELNNAHETDDGEFESLTVVSAEDFAALDVSYLEGDEVYEQRNELRGDFEALTRDEVDVEKLDRLDRCDARFDIMHFQRVSDDEGEDMVDPGALLAVVDALVELTGGVGIDPQSGTLM